MAKKGSSSAMSVDAPPRSEQMAGDTRNQHADIPLSHNKTESAFEDMYLRQATKEFAEDLEKLRTASDFKGEKSVQILVDALKQGTACFGDDEKQRLS